MHSPITFNLFPKRPTRRPTALERLTSAFARSHQAHVSPIVGCYLCLHGVPRCFGGLAAAA